MKHALEPDPSRGVFSTMLVIDGRPVEIDPHLALLRASVGALYGIELPPAAADLVLEEAREFALARVRLACRADAEGAPRLEAAVRAVTREIVLPDTGLDLRAAPVEGWYGAHKWVDRRLLDQLEAAASPASALLVERDGRVLETTRANVFALADDGVLRTPPVDGSILPGVTRAAAIALARDLGAEVREEPVTIGRLRDAREVFATGSIRGVEWVRSLDGAPVGGGVRGELAHALGDALRDRWLAPEAASGRPVRAGRA